jgi:hypothetical protein
VHGPDWRQTHGLGNLKTCKACHEPDKCVGCHGMPIPHDPAFPGLHGQYVIERGTQECFVCHRQEACRGCHGIEMPHREDYLKTHTADVEKLGEKLCARCHDKSTCDDCHTQHAHPGIDQELLRRLRANPVRQP